MTIRDQVTGPGLSPPWLCGYNSNAQKFMYVMGIATDALLEKQRQAMIAKIPGLSDPTAIPLQANDRLLIQGPAELNADFNVRMKRFVDTWNHSGSRPAIMEEIQAYMSNLQPGVDVTLPELAIVGGNTTTSTWSVLSYDDPIGSAPARSTISPANWNWDNLERPWRCWLVLYMHLVATGNSGSSATVASVSDGFATITGLAGITSADVQTYLTLTGASSGGNNGTFQIVAAPSSSSVIVANPDAVAPDANDGAIAWLTSAYPYIGPSPVWGAPTGVWGGAVVATGYTSNTGNVTTVLDAGYNGILSTVTGLSGMTSQNVGQWLIVTGAATSGNNGTFLIYDVPSSTSVRVINPSAVAPDANNGSIVCALGEDDGSSTWGLNCSPNVIAVYRLLLKRWKSARTYYPNIIISFGGGDGAYGTECSPATDQGAGNADGSWGEFGKEDDGVWIPSRVTVNPFTAFCDGTGLAVECYEKNIT